MEDNIVVSTNELQILSELDARQFGFIRLTEEAHAAKKTAALKAMPMCIEVFCRAFFLFSDGFLYYVSCQISKICTSTVPEKRGCRYNHENGDNFTLILVFTG